MLEWYPVFIALIKISLDLILEEVSLRSSPGDRKM